LLYQRNPTGSRRYIMSNNKCPRCGRSYPSSYKSCPYCSEQPERRRRKHREPDNPVDWIAELLRQHGERIFLGVTAVFLLIAVFGMILTHRSNEPEPNPTPDTEVKQPEDEDPPPVEEPLNISNTTLSLAVGETAALIVTGSEEAPVWTSSDEAVAAIADGIVTANASGTATITAACGTRRITCVVTVREKDPDVEVYLNRTDFTLRPGEGNDHFQLEVKVRETKKPYEGGIVWSVEDPSIATVSETGFVQRVSRGTTKVTATMGTKVLECIVRVS